MNSYDYPKYLQSAHWRKVKRDYAKQFKRVCYLCDSQDNLELHHVTYERIGDERLTDLVYLCENCHGFIHQDIQEARNLRAWIDPVLRPAQGVHDNGVLWGKKQETKPAAPAVEKKKPTSSRDKQAVITIGVYKDVYSVVSGSNVLTKRIAGESAERVLLLGVLEAGRFAKTDKAMIKARGFGIKIEIQDKSILSCLQTLKQLKARGWRMNNGYKLLNTDLWEEVLAFYLGGKLSFDHSKSTGDICGQAVSAAKDYWKSQALS